MSTPEIAELARLLAEARDELVRINTTQAIATPAGGTTSSAENKKLESIIDTRILGKIGVFGGDDQDWKQWCFVFESTAGLIDLGTILLASETEDEGKLVFANQTSDVQLRMKALYHLHDTRAGFDDLADGAEEQRRRGLEAAQSRVRATIWRTLDRDADGHLEARVGRGGDWRC